MMKTTIKALCLFLSTGFCFYQAKADNLIPPLENWSVQSGKATLSVESNGDTKTLLVTLPNDGQPSASWIRSPQITVHPNMPYRLVVRVKSADPAFSESLWAGARVYENKTGWNPPDGSKYIFEVPRGKKRWTEGQESSGVVITREETKNLFIGILLQGNGSGEVVEIEPVSLEETDLSEEKNTQVIKLEPGEGTILFIGDNHNKEEILQKYFSKAEPPESGSLSKMIFGLYLPDIYAMQNRFDRQQLTVDTESWYGQLLEFLQKSGMNTLFIQGGGDPTKPDQLKSFSALCAKYGIQIIVQPGPLYFGGSAYKAWVERQQATKKEDTSYRAFFEDFIGPQLDKYLPAYREETNIFAWAPVEELSPDLESDYVAYKKKIRTLLPHQRIFQLDSPQNTKERLSSKREPIPDIFAFDRYAWWHQNQTIDGKQVLALWTPHFATRWLYGAMKEYAEAVDALYDRPAIAVLQGGARLRFYGADWTNRKGVRYAEHYGWEAHKDFFLPSTPDLKYDDDLQLWSLWSMYLPPKNAYRLMNWLSVCAGYKGVMLWSSLHGTLEAFQERIRRGEVKSGDILSRGILDYALQPTPQWVEFSDSIQNIAHYAPLILSWKPINKEYVWSADPHVFINAFVDAEGRKFAVIVNGQIGEWGVDGRSPDWTTKTTGLSVGDDGNLTGYTPLSAPREIMVTVKNDESIYDLREMFPKNGRP